MVRKMINTRIYPGIILLACLLLATGAGAIPYGYITNSGTATVSIIDTTTDSVIDTVNVELLPIGVAISPDSTKVYVTHYANNSVSVIDTATHSIIATVKVGTFPYGIVVTPDGSKVYVAHSGSNSVSVIDTGTNTVVGGIPVGYGPYGMTVTPDGTKVYVANSNSYSISVIDTATNTVFATVDNGFQTIPCCVAVTPDGAKVYVTNSNKNNVSVIDTATNTITASVTVESNPVGVAVTPDGTKIYVANSGSDSVSVIDTATNTVITTINVDDYPYGIAVTPDGTKVYVANYYSNTVSVINTATDTVSNTVNVDSYPLAFGQFISSYPIPTEASAPLNADFTATITSGIAPLTVQFQDTSQGNPTGWNWDVDGDGFSDYSEKNCIHTYSEPGDYTVTLSVTGNGALDSIIRTAYIHILSELPTSEHITLNLHPGWNFISVLQTLAEGHRTAGEVFSGVETGGHSIFWYDASHQNWDQINPNDTLDPFKGIWVYSVSSAQVTLTLYEDPSMEHTVVLQPGWNAIGFPFIYSAREALFSVQNAWTHMFGYDSGSQMYETSIVNGGSGAHSDMYPVIPGKGYWVFMNEGGTLSFSIFPLETDFPMVDESYPVYRIITPNLTNEEIQQLGTLFGVSGDVEDFIPSSGISRITDYSTDPYAIFEYNHNSGSYTYQIPDKAMPSSTNIQPDLPSDEEARVIATRYLLERNLLPEGVHFCCVSIGSSYGTYSPTSTTVYNLTKHVRFTREIEGIPVYSGGITVTIGEGGEVVGVTNSVGQYDPVPVLYMKIRSPVQAYERLRAGDLIMRPLCCTSYYAVRNISLGYLTDNQVGTHEYMLPVYAFECHESSGTEEITLFVWAVDPSDV